MGWVCDTTGSYVGGEVKRMDRWCFSAVTLRETRLELMQGAGFLNQLKKQVFEKLQ